jgi:hypothetical protein
LSQSWDDKTTGQRRYKTVVRAEDVIVLDAKQSENEPIVESEVVDGIEDTEDIPF